MNPTLNCDTTALAPRKICTKCYTISLGNSGLKVSKIILGTMGFGSKQWQDWVLDEEDSLPLIEHAYKRGINTWDTVRGALYHLLEQKKIL